MSIAIKSLKTGAVLYDCHKERAGNTTMSVMRVWKIQVLEVNLEEGKALISWNGNSPVWKTEQYFQDARIRRTPPEWSTIGIFEGRTCYFCRAKEVDGHTPTCTHPKAKKR